MRGIDRDDGDGRPAAHLSGDTAPQKVPQGSPAMRAHHDQVGFLLPGDSDDFVRRLADRDQRPEAVRRSRWQQGRELPLSLLAQISMDELRRRCKLFLESAPTPGTDRR